MYLFLLGLCLIAAVCAAAAQDVSLPERCGAVHQRCNVAPQESGRVMILQLRSCCWDTNTTKSLAQALVSQAVVHFNLTLHNVTIVDAHELLSIKDRHSLESAHVGIFNSIVRLGDRGNLVCLVHSKVQVFTLAVFNTLIDYPPELWNSSAHGWGGCGSGVIVHYTGVPARYISVTLERSSVRGFVRDDSALVLSYIEAPLIRELKNITDMHIRLVSTNFTAITVRSGT